MIPVRVPFPRSLIGGLVMPLLLLGMLAGCSEKKTPTEEKKAASPVAQNGPKLQPVRPVQAMPVRERVSSQGDCAPRYKAGGRGSCINNQPCRGFGVKAENGKVICTCYGRDGGCGEGQRCDALRLSCIPEAEQPFGHAPAD